MPEYKIKCRECGQRLDGDENFCPRCKNPIGGKFIITKKEKTVRKNRRILFESQCDVEIEVKVEVKCKKCGRRLRLNENFCSNCGEEVGGKLVVEEEQEKKKGKGKSGCFGCAVLLILLFAMCEGLTGKDKSESESKAPKAEVAEAKKAKAKQPAAKAEPVKKAKAEPSDQKHARFLKKCYTTAQVMLRSDTTDQATQLAALPYGSELEACVPISSWYKLTVSLTNLSCAGGKEGYVRQAYIMNEKDFKLLNSIWGSFQSRDAVERRRDMPPTEFRRALLNYYKKKGYTGRLSAEEKRYIGLKETAEEWQVFMREGEVVFQKLPSSKYTGIGFLIEKRETGERKFLFFHFDNQGKAKLLTEQPAPKGGKINSIEYDNASGQVTVKYY